MPKISVYRQLSELEQLDDEWGRFLCQVGCDQIQHTLSYICAAVRRGGFQPVVVVARLRGKIIAAAPFYLDDSWHSIRISVLKLGRAKLRLLKLFGDEFLIANAGDVRGGEPDEFLDDDVYNWVFAELATIPEIDLIALEEIAVQGRLGGRLDNISHGTSGWRVLRKADSQLCHCILFPRSFDEYQRSLKSRDRTNLRRRRKRLNERFAGGLSLMEFRSPEQVPHLLAAVNDVYAKTWHAKVLGPRDRDTAEEVEFCLAIARRGWLRSYILYGNQTPLAFQMGFQFKSTYEFFETGFDSEWAKFGPGAVLEYMVIEDLLSHDSPQRGDFGFGDAEYKRLLSNASHYELRYIYMSTAWKLRPRVIVWIIATLDWSEKALRWILKRTSLETTVRRLLKRQGRPTTPPDQTQDL